MKKNIMLGSIDLNSGENLVYRQVGEGDKILLFIHGNMSSSKHWEPVLDLLPDGYKAYAVDLRGMGDSTYNKTFDSLKELAQDLKEFVDLMGIDVFDVIGWSTGGGIAMELAIELPSRVRKVVLVESVSYKGYPMFKKSPEGNMLIGEYYSSKEEMAKDPIQVLPALMAMQTGNKDIMKQIWDMAIYVYDKPSKEDYDEFLEATLKQRNLIDIDWALCSFNLSHDFNGVTKGTGKIDKLKQPVLSFWGEGDIVVTKDMVESTVMAIGDNAEMVVLEKSGHSPITDCPKILLDKITAFLGD